MLNIDSIKNIIFDLGGVVINLDYSKTRDSFIKLGFTEFDSYFAQVSQLELLNSFETGCISASAFRDGIRRISVVPLSDIEIDQAWNAMLLDFPEERKELLMELRTSYRTFLLSNTNTIHIDHYNSYLKEQHHVEGMNPFFEKVYYSHELHLRKPDVAIFEYVTEKNGLIPEQTLFIDDTLMHVEGARKAGLKAIHLQKGTTIVDLFR
jgi:glucose-1-phosphatase